MPSVQPVCIRWLSFAFDYGDDDDDYNDDDDDYGNNDDDEDWPPVPLWRRWCRECHPVCGVSYLQDPQHLNPSDNHFDHDDDNNDHLKITFEPWW